MAAGALKKITAEAKKIRKRKPKTSWKSAVKQAGAKYRAGKIKPRRKKAAVKKRAVRKKAVRKKSVRRKTATKIRRRVVRVSGTPAAVGSVRKRRRKKTTVTRTTTTTRRRVGSSGRSMMPLVIGALGLGAIYLMTQNRQPNVVYVPTGNTIRDSQAQQIMNWVAAAGASAAQIAALIASLNDRPDSDVNAAYEQIQQGQNPNWLYA